MKDINELKPFSEKEFKVFCSFIYETAGINLTEKKYSLVNNRLRKRVKLHNFSSYNEYFTWVRDTHEGQEELENLINQITTNVSNFYREPKQLKIFYENVLPAIAEKKDKIRIWSAGCSTGEEPYTLVMLLQKFQKLKFEIIATDLSTKVLKYAQEGVYTKDQIKDVTKESMEKHFRYDKQLNKYIIDPKVKSYVKFGQLNLIHDKYPSNIDFIFCRNVIIYFDRNTKDQVMHGFHNSLLSDGLLFLGHSESLFNNPMFKFYKPSIYLKV